MTLRKYFTFYGIFLRLPIIKIQAVNVVAIHLSPFIGLCLSMLCLVIGMAFIWMLQVEPVIEQNKALHNKTHGSIKNPLILLCLFVYPSIKQPVFMQLIPAIMQLTVKSIAILMVKYILK